MRQRISKHVIKHAGRGARPGLRFCVVTLLSLLLVLSAGNPLAQAQAAVRVLMPAAWLPHLEPVLATLNNPTASWLAVAEDAADFSLAPAGASSLPVSGESVNLATLAAVVPVESDLLDLRADVLRSVLGGNRAALPGWQVVISHEAADLFGVAMPEQRMGHAEALAAARRLPNTMAVVRWQTAGWPPGLRPVRLDGAYPGTWSLVVTVTDSGPAAATMGGLLREALQAWSLPPVEMAAVGDVMLARSLAIAAAHTGDNAFATRRVAELLAPADLAIGNLECTLSDRGAPLPKTYTFRAPPIAVEALRLASFDVLSLSNNHTLDYGVEALMDTILTLNLAGIAPTGAGLNAMIAQTPAILERHGQRFAFLGYANVPDDSSSSFRTRDTAATMESPGIAWAEPETVAAGVAAARASADHVIVLLHSGYEYQEAPNAIQLGIARAALDAGATAVIGAHPHVLQGVEYRGSGLIAYSLGNFVFDMTVADSAVLRLWIGREGVRAYAWEPVTIAADGQPHPASLTDSARIRATLARLTARLNP